MPRTGPRRVPITVKLSQTGLDHVDQRAGKEIPGERPNGKRSEMIRRLLSYAVTHMPEGWGTKP